VPRQEKRKRGGTAKEAKPTTGGMHNHGNLRVTANTNGQNNPGGRVTDVPSCR